MNRLSVLLISILYFQTVSMTIIIATFSTYIVISQGKEPIADVKTELMDYTRMYDVCCIQTDSTYDCDGEKCCCRVNYDKICMNGE